MSQIQKTMPPLEVPPNTRDGFIFRNDLFWLSLRTSVQSVALAVCLALECVLFSIIYLYGAHALFKITIIQYVIIVISICLFYSLMCLLTLIGNRYKESSSDIPVAHGFTQDYLYGASLYYQRNERWQYYSHWKEVKGYFLLLQRGRWHLLPKTMWTEEEQSELRAIMRQKVGKLLPSSGVTP